MNTFYVVEDNLEKEVSQTIFELFDDINLICDSYEVNEEIRKADKSCIDVTVLKKKVIKCMEVLQGSDTK